jgi:hypothetical protein
LSNAKYQRRSRARRKPDYEDLDHYASWCGPRALRALLLLGSLADA